MKSLHRFCSLFNRLNNHLGRLLAYLLPAIALLGCLGVIMRYGFNTGSVRLEETMLYMQSALFMLGTAYCHQRNKHIRIDAFYAQFSERRRLLINICGDLFLLLPLAVALFFLAWEYVANAWSDAERSAEPGGLPYLYLLKTLLLIMPLLLFLQVVANTWNNYLALQKSRPR